MPNIPRPDINVYLLQMYVVLALVAVAFVLSAAGVLSGVGLFILSMVTVDKAGVVGSSVLLTTSLAVFVALYWWATE